MDVGMDLDEFKAKASGLGHQTLCRDEPGAKAVPINSWNGFSSHLAGGGPTASAMIEYFIEGNKLRVHKALEGDIWYTLSKDG